MLSLLRLECKQTNSSNPFRVCIFLFLSYSFGIETINMFIHSRSSFENHTRFQTKMGKVYNPFSDQNSAKTLPDGAAHTYIAYTREYPPGDFLLEGSKQMHHWLYFYTATGNLFHHSWPLKIYFIRKCHQCRSCMWNFAGKKSFKVLPLFH